MRYRFKKGILRACKRAIFSSLAMLRKQVIRDLLLRFDTIKARI